MVDRRVLRGLFRKKLKDFDEKHHDSWNKLTLISRLRRDMERSGGIPGGNFPDLMTQVNLGPESNYYTRTAKT